MFASQLLRILQSIPSDVKYETCVFDPDEQYTTMKEKQNMELYDAKQFGREANHLAMENEEIYQLNGSETDTSPVAFDVKAKDGCWNPFMDDSSIEEDDAYKLSSEMDNQEKSREHECSMEVVELTQHSEKQTRDSSSSCVAASDLSEKETNLYTDKKKLDCDLPEFTVCYKEINYHIVKDICVDEGLPVKDKISRESYKHEESEHFIFQSHENNQFEAKEGGVDMKCFVSEELATSSLDNNKGKNEDEFEMNEEVSGNLNPKLPTESCLDKDSPKHSDSEDSVQHFGEAKYASKEESFIDKTLPIQEFGTRSFLRSFMSSLDSEENRVDQLPDQIPSGKAVSGIPATSSTEAESKLEDVQSTSLLYNSKVETGSITFNFNSNAEVLDDKTEHVNELSACLENLHDHESASADSVSEAAQVELTSNNDECKEEDSHKEQSLKSKNEEKNDDSSAAIEIQSISENELNYVSTSVEKIDNSNDLSVGGQNPPENDGNAVEPNKHKQNLQHEKGETSFSAASLMTFSGPIAYSGSLSVRSDGSATSGRSFAFPVLQNEWNSSPVRMAKADGRDFRRHKGWRSGLLCCRF